MEIKLSSYGEALNKSYNLVKREWLNGTEALTDVLDHQCRIFRGVLGILSLLCVRAYT